MASSNSGDGVRRCALDVCHWCGARCWHRRVVVDGTRDRTGWLPKGTVHRLVRETLRAAAERIEQLEAELRGMRKSLDREDEQD